jgi:hypothetical protein
MKIFKELKNLGYIHYSATTIEELDNLPLNSAERVSEQALVLRFFRKKYVLLGFIEPANGYEDKSLFAFYICDDEQNIVDDSHSYSKDSSLHFRTYEEAELACLIKLIEILKTKNKL